MIRFSALLVALAIGLLVAGVAASNLPLVYVSIAVCAVAALLLAAGVLRHWSEIFGTGAKRPVSPFAASQPVSSPAAVGRAASRPAAASRAAASRSAVAGRSVSQDRAGTSGAPGMAGFRAEAGAGAAAPSSAAPSSAARGPEPTVAADRPRGRPGRRPAAPEPEPAEPIHAAPTDDLWDRVNEELESAGKRDSGRLSWPAGDFSIPSGMSLPSEPPAETLGGPAGSHLWQPAAGWQPPSTPQSNWPFAPPTEPASTEPGSTEPGSAGPGSAGPGSAGPGSAGPTGRDTDREAPGPAAREAEAAKPAERDDSTRSARAWDAPIRAEAAQPAVAEEDEAGDGTGPDDMGRGAGARAESARAESAREDEAGSDDEDAASMWTIRPPAGPGTESTVVSKPPTVTPPVRTPEPSPAAEPAATEPTESQSTESQSTESSGDAEAGEAAEADAAAEVAQPATAAEASEEPAAAETTEATTTTETTTGAEPADAADSGSAGQPDQAGKPETESKPAGSAAPDRAVTQVGATQVTAPPKADSAKADAARADAARADAARAETGSGRGDPDKPAKPAGPVQVTVVPGVARYHRSECILIRFLGEGDLETMSKQEAVAAGLTACRACQPDQLPDG